MSESEIEQRARELLETARTVRRADECPPDAQVVHMTDALRAIARALEAAPKVGEWWVRAWRNRFISERMNAYPNDSYEVCRAKAEADANDFEESFAAEMAKRAAAPTPPTDQQENA